MRRRVLGGLLAGSLLLSGAMAACDQGDRPEIQDVEEGVEEGVDEIEQQIEEGAEEGKEGNREGNKGK